MTQKMMILITVLIVLAVFFLIVMIIDGNRFRVVEYELQSDKVKEKKRLSVCRKWKKCN